MSEELKEDWCRNFSKGLAVFNKAFIRRAGKGLFPYVLLKGEKSAADFCIRKEAALFFENGIYDTDTVHSDITEKKRGVFSAGKWSDGSRDLYEKLAKDGSLLFFTDGRPDHANEYDVSGCGAVSLKESLVPLLGMDLSTDLAEQVIDKYPDIMAMDMMEVANNTMLCHYSNADDEILRLDDFRWVENGPEEEPAEKAPDNEQKKEEAAAQRPEPVEKENSSDKRPASVVIPAPAKTPVKTDDDSKKDEAEKASSETGQKEKEPEKARDSEEENKVNDYGLTPEDEENNEKFLAEIRKEYDTVLSMIAQETVPAMFAPLKRVLESSKESNDYSESPIKKYIEISKDFATDIYNRLYKTTEPMRQNFNEKVKRKMKHITCFNCSKEWDVDVTFMDGSIGESECPKCKTLVRFEP